jgi:hypothetical protein
MRKKIKPITEDNFDNELDDMLDIITEFMKRISDTPDTKHLRSLAAEELISEIVIWGSTNMYQAFGILEECKFRHREVIRDVNRQEMEEERNKQDANFFTQVMMMSAGGGEA